MTAATQTGTDATIVIVGGGLAGASAAQGAREAGFEGRVVMIGAEPTLPYERPPLSKAVLRGEAEPASAAVHEPGFYPANDIEVRTGRTVTALDVEHHQVHLDGGEVLTYTAAVLATGAEPRRLPVPGASLGGVHHLRTIDDAVALRDAIAAAQRIAVIGAGWIGSEVAASARQMGTEVTLIDPAITPLHRVLGRRLGDTFATLHAAHGVRLRLGTRVTELQGDSAVRRVLVAEGSSEEVDLVVVGIGVVPRLQLAVEAGLVVDDGVIVDDRLRTSVPDVWAAGDIAQVWYPRYKTHLRTEHWASARNQGRVAGRNAAGVETILDRLPSFYSDQYDLGLEYVGHHEPGDEPVVRGSLVDRTYLAFWHHERRVTAAMAVNVWDVIDDLEELVAHGGPIDARRLADPAVSLKDLAA